MINIFEGTCEKFSLILVLVLALILLEVLLHLSSHLIHVVLALVLLLLHHHSHLVLIHTLILIHDLVSTLNGVLDVLLRNLPVLIHLLSVSLYSHLINVLLSRGKKFIQFQALESVGIENRKVVVLLVLLNWFRIVNTLLWWRWTHSVWVLVIQNRC